MTKTTHDLPASPSARAAYVIAIKEPLSLEHGPKVAAYVITIKEPLSLEHGP